MFVRYGLEVNDVGDTKYASIDDSPGKAKGISENLSHKRLLGLLRIEHVIEALRCIVHNM